MARYGAVLRGWLDDSIGFGTGNSHPPRGGVGAIGAGVGVATHPGPPHAGEGGDGFVGVGGLGLGS